MKFRHKQTGEERDFIQGMHVHSNWAPVLERREGKATISLVEIDPISIPDPIKEDGVSEEELLEAGVPQEEIDKQIEENGVEVPAAPAKKEKKNGRKSK